MPVFWLNVSELRHQVQRILQLVGRRLVGLRGPSALPCRSMCTSPTALMSPVCWIVGEMVAIDLVVAVVVLAVDHDVHVLQIGVAALLELHRLGRPDGVDGAAALGLGKRETVAGLLDVDAELLRNVVQDGSNAGTGDPVGNGDGGHQHTHACDQPFPYLS